MGHVNVRWNLYMMLLLRDDPSLELVHDVVAGNNINKRIWKYIRSFQWRWENQIDLLSATAKALQNL